MEQRGTGLPGEFRLLVTAYAVTSYGSYLNMIALNLFVYELTGSAFGMGLFLAVRLACGAAAGLVAGPLVARVPRKRIMLWSNVAPAATLVLLVLVPPAGRTAVLLLNAVVTGGGTTLFLVALRSAVPDMVGMDRRDRANSLTVIARSLAMVVGFASAGLVVAWRGYPATFLIDAASFAICAAAVASLPLTGSAAHESPATPGGGRPGRTRATLGTLLVLMIGLRTMDALGSSSHNSALPVYSALIDRADPAGFVSRFLTCWAVGNIVVQQGIRLRAKSRGRTVGAFGFALGTVLMSTAFILGFAGLPTVITMAIAVGAGCADGLTEVSYANYLQTLPGTRRDRVFGLSATAENLGFGTGMLATSFLLDRLSPFAVVAASHGVTAVIGLLFCIGLWRHARRTGRAGHVGTSDRDHRDVTEVPGG
ncbi:MFS transporter [Streptomyces fodineus]|uniref:MFS transporter n=1 Tax=Streptomyces fodineus TaxID=1904616 RepID=UPI00131E7518|nr:MFS transporter [Streptomyces fodineus]